MQKLKLAFVSSFNEPCANADYTDKLVSVFKNTFDITVFDIKSAAILKRLGVEAEKVAETHIGEICHQLRNFDIVNIQCEMGLFGATVEQCKRRLYNLCFHSPCLIYTLHSYSTRGDDFEAAHQWIFESLKQRTAEKPWTVLVHLKRDRQVMTDRFGIPAVNVVDYPVLSLSVPERNELIANANATEWKIRNGMKGDDIVIGRVGFFSQNKDFLTGLKALCILPPNYKMAFVGGQHFQTITEMAFHPSIKEVVDFIDQHDNILVNSPNYDPDSTILLRDRVVFIGNQENRTLYEALVNMDYILVNYLETWQSGSLIASLCMELQKPCLFSYNNTFLEYDKYFKNCFEFFNMGNHHEIKHKIMFFDYSKLNNIPEKLKLYTIEQLGEMYQAITINMKEGMVNKTNAEGSKVSKPSWIKVMRSFLERRWRKLV